MTECLKLEKISIAFGGLKAVSNFDLEINKNEICGLIGPNGAGKTTIFNLITGVYQPDTGTMTLNGKSIKGLPPYEIAKAGIARTFQNIRLFGDLSVLQNVLVAYHMRIQYGFIALSFRTPSFVEIEDGLKEKAMSLLEIFGLELRADHVAKSLSYGDQRRLEIARALATGPSHLLLDEPAAGLNPQEKKELMLTVAEIRNRFNVGILLIEHDMRLVMGVCERISVLDHGELIATGSPKQIQENPRVIQAYLGVG
jgi:branched-chain amino acid transport system ATP-binding protein